ncbi:MAG TPA: S8 family serine peptidase [Tepidisphaeraceae bacterium]|jgi:hypothetical protein|nr:S8 family serine peptidase [Tepidisphaeraceae bacterium]
MHAVRRRALTLACALFTFGVFSSPSHAIVSSNLNDSVFDGVNINQLIGAEDFYALGYAGSRAVVANVEAGLIWNGHDDLAPHLVTDPLFGTQSFFPGTVSQYIFDPSIGPQENLYDYHATMVGDVIGGFGSFNYGYILQDSQGTQYNTAWGYGIAPLAQVWSAAIATSWNPDPTSDFTGSFNISQQSFTYAYRTTMETGINGRRADVINSSWGYDDPDGSANETKVIDALAYAYHQTVVIAAGNHDPGTNPAVTGPASGFNSISVAALSSDTSNPVYGYVADFSNRGVNDFTNPKVLGGTVPESRVAVDIAAPGDNFTLAAYLGLTGGHTSNDQMNLDPSVLSGTGYYFLNAAGTSFAAPVVSGAASLLVDLGYDRFNGGTSVDGRVIKAVLLNSATKIAGWDNGEAYDSKGVLRTSQALDPSTGTGMLNLHSALLQYTGGTTDVPGLSVNSPHVAIHGWDFATSTPGINNDYYIDDTVTAGTPIAATLDWFVDRTSTDDYLTADDVSFADLDLEVWLVINGVPVQLIATSDSAYSNVEHLYFPAPLTGEYMLRVLYFGDAYNPSDPSAWTPESYAVAWMVPEPSTIVLMICILMPIALGRRRGYIG